MGPPEFGSRAIKYHWKWNSETEWRGSFALQFFWFSAIFRFSTKLNIVIFIHCIHKYWTFREFLFKNEPNRAYENNLDHFQSKFDVAKLVTRNDTIWQKLRIQKLKLNAEFLRHTIWSSSGICRSKADLITFWLDYFFAVSDQPCRQQRLAKKKFGNFSAQKFNFSDSMMTRFWQWIKFMQLKTA